MANTFHGVPDKQRLSEAIFQILTPSGIFAIVNWHLRPKEETVVLGKARGPRTEMRMKPSDVAAVVEPAGLTLRRTIELPPYHYGAMFEKSIREAHYLTEETGG
jgi:hypothetical protein